MIVVDSREQHKDYLTSCFSRWNVEWTIAALEYGDYCLPYGSPGSGGNIGIERKSWSDLLGSMPDLGRKLSMMKRTYDAAVLLLEGDILFDAHTGKVLRANRMVFGPMQTRYNIRSIDNFLWSVTTKGIYYYHTMNLSHTALFLSNLDAYAQKEWHEPLGLDLHSDEGRTLGMFSLLPGCDDVLGRRLRERFASLAQLMLAPLEEIRDVKGIGPKKALRVFTFLHPDTGVR